MKRNRVLLLAATVLLWFSIYIYTPYQTPFLAAMGVTASFTGIIIGAYGFFQMAVRLPMGLMADRRGRHKPFIIAAAALAAAASVIRLCFRTGAAFLAANLISGLAASMWISYTVLFSSYYKPDEAKRAMGTLMAFNNIGILLGFAAGSLLSEAAGIPVLFAVSAAAGAAGCAAALFLKEERPGSEADVPEVRELIKVIANKKLILFSLAAAMLQAVHMSTAMSFTSRIAESLTDSTAQIGICSLVYMACSVASSYFAGTKPAARIGDRILMPVLFSMMAIYCIFTPAVSSMAGLYAMQVIGGFGNAALLSLLMARAFDGTAPENKSTAMGFLQAVYGAGMMAVPMLMGVLVDSAGIEAAYLAMAGLCVIGIVLAAAGCAQGRGK